MREFEQKYSLLFVILQNRREGIYKSPNQASIQSGSAFLPCNTISLVSVESNVGLAFGQNNRAMEQRKGAYCISSNNSLIVRIASVTQENRTINDEGNVPRARTYEDMVMTTR
jgi:hypothetical protein